MKRFMKGCALTALVFAVLGSMLAFVGSRVAGRTTVSQVVEAVTGGKMHLDSGHWWKWPFWLGDRGDSSVVQMEETCGEAWDDTDYGCHEYNEWEWDEGSVEFVNEYEISKGNVDRFCPGEDIRNLELELGGCIVEFAYSENEYLYLEAQDAYKFQSYLKGNTLHVKAEGRSAENWMGDGSCCITLYVPWEYVFDEVDLELGAGYVNFRDLYAKKASVEAGAGEIYIQDANVTKMDISVGAGSVTVENMEIDELEAEIGMGSFQADGEICKKADIECSMGYVDLYLKGEEEDFNYQLNGAMGNIEIGGMSFSGFSQEKKIVNGASKVIEVDCSMGSISILFQD